jgi:hypothetical protein
LVESGPINYWYESIYTINKGESTDNYLYVEFTETIFKIGWFVSTWNQLTYMLSTIALQTSVVDTSTVAKDTRMTFALTPTAYTVQQTVSTYD